MNGFSRHVHMTSPFSLRYRRVKSLTRPHQGQGPKKPPHHAAALWAVDPPPRPRKGESRWETPPPLAWCASARVSRMLMMAGIHELPSGYVKIAFEHWIFIVFN